MKKLVQQINCIFYTKTYARALHYGLREYFLNSCLLRKIKSRTLGKRYCASVWSEDVLSIEFKADRRQIRDQISHNPNVHPTLLIDRDGNK